MYLQKSVFFFNFNLLSVRAAAWQPDPLDTPLVPTQNVANPIRLPPFYKSKLIRIAL